MLRVSWEDVSGRYVLELTRLHTAGREPNAGGRSGVVYVEQCVILRLSKYLVVRLRKRCAGVRGRRDGDWILCGG